MNISPLESFNVAFHGKSIKYHDIIGRFSYKSKGAARIIKFYLNTIGNDLKFNRTDETPFDFTLKRLNEVFLDEWLCGCCFTGNRFKKECNWSRDKNYSIPCIPVRLRMVLAYVLKHGYLSTETFRKCLDGSLFKEEI